METALTIILVSIFLLLIISAVLSGSETALTATSRARMHQLKRKGNRRARMVEKLTDRKEHLLSTILLGNNLVNILASALATSALIGIFGDAGVAYATAIMTLLILVFAEILPKTYAIRHADRAALALAPLIGGLVFVFGPISTVLQAIVRFILHMIGAAGPQNLASAAEEEIRGAIDLYAKEEGRGEGEKDMLGGVLDLAHVDVSEIMVHRQNMRMIDISQTPSQIIAQVLDSPYTRIPVWRDDQENIIGILHAKDVLRAVSDGERDVDSIDIISIVGEPWFVPETTSLADQLRAFRLRKSHLALVVDEYGALMGLVTMEDILEEIVGEISDEYDLTAAPVRALDDGSFSVEGLTTIRDLNRRFDWTLPDEEAATIAGLVMYEARVIPEVGQVFTFHGFRFEVMRRTRTQITNLRITPPAKLKRFKGRPRRF
jgi:Mg2+/Co2+ transporter CorB